MNKDPLVSVDWLADRLEAPDLRVIDATWFLPGDPRDAKDMFWNARIPNAIFFDIDEICDLDSPLPHMLPAPEKFASRMRKLGIGDGMQIVVYDSDGLFSAPRVWWTFRVMGVEDVYVLDGGLPAWRAAGKELEDGPPLRRQERHFTARIRADLLRNLSDMRRATESGKADIVDARPAGRFQGTEQEPRPNLRPGHIPGSRSVPWADLLDAERRMKPAAELAPIFDAAGVDRRKPLICTCGSGVTAAMDALALARLGRWDVAVYDGAWAEWGGLPDTPVATGPA
jgi:thiosulfate/3-mercaptopyruvate sulfurtransferase